MFDKIIVKICLENYLDRRSYHQDKLMEGEILFVLSDLSALQGAVLELVLEL